jgi:hypothetical protein
MALVSLFLDRESQKISGAIRDSHSHDSPVQQNNLSTTETGKYREGRKKCKEKKKK